MFVGSFWLEGLGLSDVVVILDDLLDMFVVFVYMDDVLFVFLDVVEFVLCVGYDLFFFVYLEIECMLRGDYRVFKFSDLEVVYS